MISRPIVDRLTFLPRWRPIAIGSVVIAICILASLLKFYHFQRAPYFHPQNDTWLFTSESALQYRYAKMVANGQSIPLLDVKAQYPEGLEVFSNLTVFMEFVSGFLYRFFSRFVKIPFHVFLIYFICFFSSLTIFPVYLISYKVWGSRFSALASTAFYAFSLPGMSRTIGNYLLEDFAFPFIFFSLYFFLVSLCETNDTSAKKYLRTLAPYLSGLFMAIALLSWHLTSFYFFPFVLYVVIKFLFQREKNHILISSYGKLMLFVIIAGIVSPVLREKLFTLSPPMLMSYSLLISYYLGKQWGWKKQKILFGTVSLILVFSTAIILAKHYQEYSHVYSLLFYKLFYLGSKPPDPTKIPYHASVLWLGSAFDTAQLGFTVFHFSALIPLGLFGLFESLYNFIKKKTTTGEDLLIFFAFVFLGSYLLVSRMFPFLGFFLCLFIGRTLLGKSRKVLIWISIILVLAFAFEVHKTITLRKQTTFKNVVAKIPEKKPAFQIFQEATDKLDLVRWIRWNTRDSDVILTWFGLSPMILAYTDRPIVIHSKFESRSIREKYKQFIFSLYGDEEKFYEICRVFQADYFVYDLAFVLNNTVDSNRYLTNNLVLKTSAAAYKFHFAPELLQHFTLLYQNSSYRIFKVGEKASSFIPKELSYQPVYDLRLFQVQKGLANHEPIVSVSEEELFGDAELEKGLQKLKAISTHMMAAQLYTQQRLYDQAIKEIQMAIEITPRLTIAYINLGAIYAMRGEFIQAIEQWEEALKIEPDNQRAKQNIQRAKLLIDRSTLPFLENSHP
jgi:hypothetical protein